MEYLDRLEEHRCCCEKCGREYPYRMIADFSGNRDRYDVRTWPVDIILDDQHFNVSEVLAAKGGEEGWVFAVSVVPGMKSARGGLHPCQTCHKGVCSYTVSGNVQILVPRSGR